MLQEVPAMNVVRLIFTLRVSIRRTFHISKNMKRYRKIYETLRRMDSYNKQSEQVVAYIKEALKKDVLDILIFVDNVLA